MKKKTHTHTKTWKWTGRIDTAVTASAGIHYAHGVALTANNEYACIQK